MYVVKFQQLFPEGDWCVWPDKDGHPMCFESREDAVRCSVSLSGDRKNRGYVFRVDPVGVPDPAAMAAAERRTFSV